METKLKSCPFCKSIRLIMNHSCTMEDREGHNFITCQNCWVDGPKSRSELHAEELWNNRMENDFENI